MKQIVMNLYWSTIMALTGLTTLYAQDTTQTSAPSLESIDCTKEELMTFFPKPVVEAVLIREQISKEQAQAIAQELSGKDQELVKNVEAKASRLDPNPFKDLNQRDLAIKIYRETLYEVFAKVLKAHDITNDERIQQLLDKVQQAKSRLFIECIRKQQMTVPISSSQ